MPFVCMNLPYTMTVEQAARAVRALRPRVVYPYHYRGSDLNKFKELVGTDARCRSALARVVSQSAEQVIVSAS
jgi:L-ascorbate metabolism protein UlaG (beta-lactamase superfamily)